MSSSRTLTSTNIFNFYRQRRYIIVFLGFFNFVNLYLLRVNLNLSVVAMTAKYPVILPNGTVVEKQEFDWDAKDRGKILSSFYYGYILTHIFGGFVGQRFGGVRTFGVGIATAGFLTVFTPIVVRTGSICAIIALRAAVGVFEGTALPAVLCVWAFWAPPKERTKLLMTMVICGISFGNVVGMGLCGILTEKLGWPSVFYVTGVVTILWSAIWMTFARDKPENDPYISQGELTFIKESIGPTVDKVNNYPVGAILMSPPVYAAIISSFVECFGNYMVMTMMPVFLNDVFQFDVATVAYLTALPYIAATILSPISGFLADLLLQKNWMTTTQVRKTFQCGAFIGQCICATLISFTTRPEFAVALLTISTGLSCFAFSTIVTNPLDMAPQYAGVVFGMMNTAGTAAGMTAPLLSGYIVSNRTMAEWKIMFFIIAGVFLIGAISYGLFGSGERQSWAAISQEEKLKHGIENATVSFQSDGNLENTSNTK